MQLNLTVTAGIGLKYLRVKKGYSLRQLSQLIGFSHTMISKIESTQSPMSEEVELKYQSFLNYRHLSPPKDIGFLDRISHKIMNGLMFYSDESLKESIEMLTSNESVFKETVHQLKYDLLREVAYVYTDRNAKMDESLWLGFLKDLPLHLSYLLGLALTHKMYIDYRFKEALNLLKKLDQYPLEDRYKSLIYEKQSDILFYQFNNKLAMSLNEKAHHIFSIENMIVRMSMCEIKNDLFKAGFNQKDVLTDYQGLIGKAIQFKLYFMVDTILFVKGIRSTYHHDFEIFKQVIDSMETRYPSFLLYYSLGLLLNEEYTTLQKTLKMKPKDVPILFKKGFDALSESANIKSIALRPFDEYLKEALYQKSYHDTWLIYRILEKHYVSKRKYKEAYYLSEVIKETVLSA